MSIPGRKTSQAVRSWGWDQPQEMIQQPGANVTTCLILTGGVLGECWAGMWGIRGRTKRGWVEVRDPLGGCNLWKTVSCRPHWPTMWALLRGLGPDVHRLPQGWHCHSCFPSTSSHLTLKPPHCPIFYLKLERKSMPWTLTLEAAGKRQYSF